MERSLHNTCALMLDVSRVGKRMNKAHVKKRVEEHRSPMTEKEQGTSRWSVCKEPCAFSPIFCRLPTYRTASRWPIPLQTPREVVEPNKYNLFLVGTLMWHRKGVIADSCKIINYHVGIHEHGAHLSAYWTGEGTQGKMERERV